MPSLTGYVKSPRCFIITEWQVIPFWDILDPDLYVGKRDFLLGSKMQTCWKSSISFSSAISYCKVKSLQLGTMPWRNMRGSNTSPCNLNLSTRGRWSLNMEVHKPWVPGRLGDLILCVVINIFFCSYVEHWTVMKPIWFYITLVLSPFPPFCSLLQFPFCCFLPGCSWSTPFLVPWMFLFIAFLSVAPSGLRRVWPIHYHFLPIIWYSVGVCFVCCWNSYWNFIWSFDI